MEKIPIEQRLQQIRQQKQNSGSVVPVSTKKPTASDRLEQIRAQKTQAPSQEQMQDQRRSAGLPVGKKEDGSPTLGGSIVREIAKMPVKLGLTLARPFVDPIGKKGGISIDSEYLGNVGDYGTEITKKTDALADRYNKGEISLGRALAGGAGAGALQAMDAASVLPVGATAKAGATAAGTVLSRGALPEIAIETAKRTLGKANIPGLKQAAKEAVIRGGAVSGGYDITEQLASGDAIKPLQTLAATAMGAGIDLAGTKLLPEFVQLARGKAQALTPKSRTDRLINKAEKEIFDIQNKYVKTRKEMDYSKDGMLQNRQRVAASGFLEGSVDNDGVMRTTQPGGAVDRYRAAVLDDKEALVREILEKEGRSINPAILARDLKKVIERDPFIKGKDKTIALRNVDEEVAAYKRDNQGNIPFTEVQDVKIATGRKKVKDFATPVETKTYQKALVRGLREVIENNSASDIKGINNELSKFYQDIELLESLDGSRVRGGRLGKYLSQVSGNIIGGAVGSIGGPLWAATGAVIGGETAIALRSRAFRNTFRNIPEPRFESSEILDAARRGLQREPLALPPANAQQPRPVGDFMPPRQAIELPDNNVAARAREAEIEAMRANQNPLPRNPNINFNTKTGIITDPKKATEAAKEFVKKQGSQNGAYAVFGMEIDEDGNVSFDPAKAAGAMAIGGFAQTKAGKEAIEKINKKATELINGKPTKEAIDSLKKEIGDVELFEKARKYKSAEEFVKAQGTPIYHGTTNKFDNFDISKVKNTQFGQSLYATNIKDIANKYGTDVKEFVISNKDKIVDIKEIGGVDGYLDLAKKIYRKETGNEFKPSKGTFKTGFDDIYYFKEVNSPKNISLKNKVNAELQKQGILGLKVPQVNGETTYIVFNPQSIKTKSQLENIWNKANKK